MTDFAKGILGVYDSLRTMDTFSNVHHTCTVDRAPKRQQRVLPFGSGDKGHAHIDIDCTIHPVHHEGVAGG